MSTQSPRRRTPIRSRSHPTLPGVLLLVLAFAWPACDSDGEEGREAPAAVDPTAYRTHLDQAKEHILTRSWEDVVRELEAAIAADPEVFEARYLMGIVQVQYLRQPASAWEHFHAALRLDPRAKEVLVNLADLAYQRAQYDEAMRYVERAIEVDPGYAQAHHVRGLVLASTGRLEDARRAFERAVEGGVGARAWFELGLLELREQRLDAARDAFERVLRLDRGHLGARLNLGRLLVRLGRVEEGERELRIHALLQRLGAKLDVDRNVTDEQRVELLRELVSLCPGHEASAYALAEWESREGRDAEAIAILERLAASRPDLAEPHARLAELHERVGRGRAARERER